MDSTLVLIYFARSRLEHIKEQPYNILDCWSRNVLVLDFLLKGLELASPPYFVYDFSRKIFLTSYSINWPNFIAWLPLLLEILGNMFIIVICLPACDVKILKLTFLKLYYQVIFLHDQKGHDKNLMSSEQKDFSSFLKAFIEANKNNFFGKWESVFNAFSTDYLAKYLLT